LLGIHEVRFPRRDPKKTRIELVDPIDKPAPFCVGLAGLAGFRIVETLLSPPVVRDFLDRIDTAAKQLPKGVGRIRSTGKSTTDADNRDGKAPGCGCRARSVR
jgi:hypothetical protein